MQSALIITAVPEAAQCAALLSKQLNLTVEVAPNRKDALLALRRREYTLVVVDEPIAEAASESNDILWRQAGLATPLQINFAISGTNRLVREMRAALQRREHEKTVATRAAATAMESELRDTVTGILLHSQLCMADPTIPAQLNARLQTVATLAGTLRNQLERSRG